LADLSRLAGLPLILISAALLRASTPASLAERQRRSCQKSNCDPGHRLSILLT
jgi:hypothetical protein